VALDHGALGKESTVWLAIVENTGDGPRLDDLFPVQLLAGDKTPFDRLVRLLVAGDSYRRLESEGLRLASDCAKGVDDQTLVSRYQTKPVSAARVSQSR
jgi:hypothetical protein